MLKQKELDKIFNALPKEGLDKISEKTGYHKDTVRRILRGQQTTNQVIVVDAALEIIELNKKELDLKIQAQKEKIKAL